MAIIPTGERLLLHAISAIVSYLLIPTWLLIVWCIYSDFRHGSISRGKFVAAVVVMNACIIFGVLGWLTGLSTSVPDPGTIVWAISACLAITVVAAPLVGSHCRLD